jgi:hypothetical protein
MKTAYWIAIAALGCSGVLTGTSPSYDAHEWGTLTTVSGSDGNPLAWYQASEDVAGLPPFVSTSLRFTKITLPAILRMETPVIYFYPEASLKVKAEVGMPQGAITEWFPTASPTLPAPSFQTLAWEGTLLPPDDAKAAAEIPPISPGAGDHYAHARDVPDAWIFRSTSAAALQSEKFIFYRGAGHFPTPVRIAAPSNTEITLLNQHPELITSAWLLHVRGKRAGWRRVEALAPSPKEAVHHPLPVPDQPVANAAAELRSALHPDLVGAGLTPAEATAMIATWEESWFTEPGTRVFCLLPRRWVDKILPLQLTPAPKRLQRVFIARLEVFTPAVETILAGLLDEESAHPGDPQRAQAFAALALGRFGPAGLQRVSTLKLGELRQAYQRLQPPAKPNPAAASAASR